MEQRERLIKLLQSVPTDAEGNIGVNRIADHLLNNGVVVPPCKVGDKVYSCIGREYYVRRIIIKDGMPTTFLLESGLYGQLCVTESDFGSLAFLTREEAEQKLKGEQNDRA